MDSNKQLDPEASVLLTFTITRTHSTSKTVREWDEWFRGASNADADLMELARENGFEPANGDDEASYVYALAEHIGDTWQGEGSFEELATAVGDEETSIEIEAAELD